jgi:hypothetical protein
LRQDMNPVASSTSYKHIPMHCTHDQEGKIEQHVLDAGDGVAAERAMQGKGGPPGAQDLIDDD